MFKAQCAGCCRPLRVQYAEDPLWEDAVTADWTCSNYGYRYSGGFKRFMHGPHVPFVCDPHMPAELRNKLGIDLLVWRFDRRVSEVLFEMLRNTA